MEQIIIELPHGMTAENLKDNPEAVAGLLRQIALAIENYERNVNWNMSKRSVDLRSVNMITIPDERMKEKCRIWEDMTERNCHTENLQSKAVFLYTYGSNEKDKDCYLQFCNVFQSILDIQEELGSLPFSLSQFRCEMMKDFYMTAKKDLPEEQYRLLYQA